MCRRPAQASHGAARNKHTVLAWPEAAGRGAWEQIAQCRRLGEAAAQRRGSPGTSCHLRHGSRASGTGYTRARKTRVGRSPTAGVSASRHTWAGQRGLWGRRKPPNPADEGSTGSSTSEFGRKDSHLRRPLTPQQVSGKTPLAPGPRAERRGLAS